MSNTFTYSHTYEPPAPVLTVTAIAQSSATFTALLDTGADNTMLPYSIIESIEPRYATSRRMRGINNTVREVDLYTVVIQIDNHTFPGIQVIAMTVGNECIIGRDVLNQLIVTLDGISGITEIS